MVKSKTLSYANLYDQKGQSARQVTVYFLCPGGLIKQLFEGKGT
jgi:hypothetical protein